MADADGDILLGPATPVESQGTLDDDDNDDVVLPWEPDADAGEEQAQQDRGLSNSLMSDRPFGGWIIGVCANSEVPPMVVGFADFDWRICEASPDSVALHAGLARGAAPSRGHDPWGYLQYTFHTFCELEQPFELDSAMDLVDDPLVAQSVTRLCSESAFRDSSAVDALLDRLGSSMLAVVLLPMPLALSFMTGDVASKLVKSVALGFRFQGLSIPSGFPSMNTLRRARRELLGNIPRGSAAVFGPPTEAEHRSRYEKVLLQLPKTTQGNVDAKTAATKKAANRWDTDPLKCLNA